MRRILALIIGIAIVVGCVVGGFLIPQPSVSPSYTQNPVFAVPDHHPEPKPPVEPLRTRQPAPPIESLRNRKSTQPVESSHARQPTPSAELLLSRQPIPPDRMTAQSQSKPQTKSPARKRRPLEDPMARVALSFVGKGDPYAEEYWIEAIFNPNLPDGKEREDLMEDLNEVGFDDPKHPGPDDIPVILRRMELILDVAPYGDDFMLEHLGEAYKDLVNMYLKASQ